MRPLLIHHHLPKTGGTSLRAVVQANHRPGEFVELYDRDAGDGHARRFGGWWSSLDEESRADIRCVGSHMAHYLMPELDRPFRAFCLLRDPVDRVWSMYHFGLWLAGRPGEGNARRRARELARREWSLADVYDQLAGGSPQDSPMHRLAEAFFNGQARSVVKPWLDLSTPFSVGMPDDSVTLRDEAFAILRRHYVVGVHERSALSLELFAEKFKWREARVPHLNPSPQPRPPAPDARTRRLILEHNEVDAQLHSHYVAAVERRRWPRATFPPVPPPAAQPVCVLGMSRSGTSVVARVLNVLGVHLGAPAELMRPHPRDNPKGYWEHAGIVGLNERLLGAFVDEPAPMGLRWRAPVELPPGWEADPRLALHRREARTLIRRSFAHRATWGWKDPRTCLTLPFWQRLVPSLRYVICVRHPLDVAASLEVRDGLTRDEALRLWLASTASAVIHTSGRPRVFVTFESWFAEPEPNVRRLAGFVGAPDPAPTQKRAIAAHLDEPMWHHRDGEDRDLPAEMQDLHEALAALGAPAAETGGAAESGVDDLARRVASAAQL